jgi:hypothetical protein
MSLLQDFTSEKDAVQNRINQIIELDENRRKAYDQNSKNRENIKRAFDKSTRQRDFRIGDTVVLWDKGKEKADKHGKFDNLWLGPYMIRETAGPNSFYLSHLDGGTMNIPRNGKQLKLFFK